MREKVLQFGEGNFLRAFIDYFIEELNNRGLFDGKVVVVQPIAKGLANVLNSQNGRYNVMLRGLYENKPTVKKREISCISRAINPYSQFDEFIETMSNPHLRFIVSNTTEAGISFVETDKLTDRPPSGFPAKVTALLYERYKIFGGDKSKGFIFIPCELIDENGAKLRETVLRYADLWRLPEEFINWVNEANHFTNTLVDQIVTGYPKDETDVIEALAKERGSKDELLVTGEIFHFFAIEAGREAADEMRETMPFEKAGLNVLLTDDVTPYKLRKVRILNGAHTMSVLAAKLCGIETVGDMVNDPLFVKFLKTGIYNEVIPTLEAVLPRRELEDFAASVLERFANPYIKHYILSIALNSVAKYKARVLPSILDYHNQKGKLPPALTMSFAALLSFYKGGDVPDDAEIVRFFTEEWQKNDINTLVRSVCARTDFWGTDLNELPGFAEQAAENLQSITTKGIRAALEQII